MHDHTAIIQQWLKESVYPSANRWEAQQELPENALHTMADLRLFGAAVPESFGGLALNSADLGQLSLHMAKASVSLLSVFVVNIMATLAISRFGDAAQKQHFLPLIANGYLKGAFALTEPEIGSAATEITCSVTKTSDGYVINGRKKWISGSLYANFFIVFCRIEGEGLSALIVPQHTPGLTIKPMRDLLGFRAAGIAELEFCDCLVPFKLPYAGAPSSLLGPVGGGFAFVASHALDTGRYIVGWGGAGILEGCLESCVAYASERKQFGVPLRKHQLIQEIVADIATEYAAVKALGDKAAHSREHMHPDSVMDVTMFKYFSSRAAFRAATNALQLHGGNGCSPDYPLQRYFRDAKICEIIEGSSQMQQLMISSAAFMRSRSRRKKKHDAAN